MEDSYLANVAYVFLFAVLFSPLLICLMFLWTYMHNSRKKEKQERSRYYLGFNLNDLYSESPRRQVERVRSQSF